MPKNAVFSSAFSQKHYSLFNLFIHIANASLLLSVQYTANSSQFSFFYTFFLHNIVVCLVYPSSDN